MKKVPGWIKTDESEYVQIIRAQIMTGIAVLKNAQSLVPYISISSGQRNLMKTYHNDNNTSGITKIALKNFLDFFGQRR